MAVPFEATQNGDVKIFYISACQKLYVGSRRWACLINLVRRRQVKFMGCWIGFWGFATVDTFSLSGWSSTCTISRSASRMVVARGYFGRVVEDARDKTSTTLEADGCNDGSCWTSLPNISWIWCRASSLGCHPLLFQTAEPIILYSLLHLTPKVNKLAARRVYVSWPLGLEANIQALDRDVKSMKDTIPPEETAPNNLTDLCFLHALLQHRSRMGGESLDSSWIMQASLKSKKHTLETEELPSMHSIEYIASLCEDVLSFSWPSNLWAVLPEQLAAQLDDSLGWNSLQGAMQEALQRHERKRRRRSSHSSRSTTDKRLHSLLWCSKAVANSVLEIPALPMTRLAIMDLRFTCQSAGGVWGASFHKFNG